MMARRYQSPADRLCCHKGFALIELLIGMAILSLLTLLVLRTSRFMQEAYYIFPEHYTRLKSEAILTGNTIAYEDETEMEYPKILFYENGIVNQARTLSFPSGSGPKTIIIELGPGALVFR